MQRAVNATIEEEAFSVWFAYIHCLATDVFSIWAGYVPPKCWTPSEVLGVTAHKWPYHLSKFVINKVNFKRQIEN
jgi:hypothetical protein